MAASITVIPGRSSKNKSERESLPAQRSSEKRSFSSTGPIVTRIRRSLSRSDTRASSSSSSGTSSHFSTRLKSTGENEWTMGNFDFTNRSFNSKSLITKASVQPGKEYQHLQAYLDPTYPDGQERYNSWTSSAADKENIYIATHDTYTPAGQRTGTTGYVYAIKRSDLSIRWRKSVSNYTSVPGDFARSTPAVTSDSIYICSGVQRPQTFATPENPDQKGYSVFSGIETPGTGTPPSMLCIDKSTGALRWRKPLGKQAQYFNSEDNLLGASMHPVVFDTNVKGVQRTVVVGGTTSGNSGTPFFNSLTPGSWFAPGAPQSVFEEKKWAMTDVGRLVFYDAHTGDELSRVYSGPPLYKAGHVLKNSDPVEEGGGYLWPGRDSFRVYHYLTADDVTSLQSGINKQFAGEQKITWILLNQFGNGSKKVPAVLDGEIVGDRFGNKVTLIGGATISNELEGVVISIRVNFEQGENTFKFNDSNFPFDNSFIEARTFKFLRDGDVLDDADAHAANYYGASLWGSGPVIVEANKNRPRMLYMGGGQCHQLPAEDVEELVGRAPMYIEITRTIKEFQDQYEANPTAANLKLVQKAAKEFDRANQQLLNVPRSPRSDRFLFCSIFGVIAEGEDFGKLATWHHAIGFDTWNLGYLFLGVQATDASGTTSIGAPGKPFQFKTLYTDVQDYIGTPSGPDGDFGTGPVYLPKSDRLMAGSKFGTGLIFDVSKGDLRLINETRISQPSTSGGVNFGMAADDKIMYANIANTQQSGRYNLTSQSGSWGSRYPLPQIFPIRLNWYHNDQGGHYIPRQSYVTALDEDGEVRWTMPPVPSAPESTTLANCSVNDDLLFIVSGQAQLLAIDKKTGKIVNQYDVEHAGIAQPIILENELAVVSARQDPTSGSAPFSKYASTPYLTVLRFN